MRLFIAINFSNETRSRLLLLQEELQRKSKRGSFTAPDNMHLTLVFLGECNPSETAAIKSVMETVTFEPLNITIDNIGRFRQDGDLWWAGVKENKDLSALQSILTGKLISENFRAEKRKYNPHITLGRRIITHEKPWKIEPFGETISTIDLMKSERINGKLTYTSIYRRGKQLKPIVVEEYNPQWDEEFKRIRDYIAGHLGGLAVAVHHVGSTSVPGLAAKPILDVDVEIESYDVFPQVCQKLADAGWRHEGDYGIDQREAFKPLKEQDFMEHHLYVCPSGSRELKWHLAFRDKLRADKSLADEYGKLKQDLAKKHGNDIDSYIDGKSAFVRSNRE